MVGGGREGADGRETATEAGRVERERARGRWGAEALSALRYVGTLLNPERLGENAARGSKGLTPPPVLVQVKGVLLLHKTGQIRPQSVSRRTTMGSSICGPHLLSPGSPPLLNWRGRRRRRWAGGGEGDATPRRPQVLASNRDRISSGEVRGHVHLHAHR